jgi:hypothetical protein
VLLANAGLVTAWRHRRFEAIRYGGALILFPLMYHFTHPEPYHLRPLDPLLVVLGCDAIVAWRERAPTRVVPRESAILTEGERCLKPIAFRDEVFDSF